MNKEFEVYTPAGNVVVASDCSITGENDLAVDYARVVAFQEMPDEPYWPDVREMVANRIASRMGGRIIRRPPVVQTPPPPGGDY
jgi:hypothetical protein